MMKVKFANGVVRECNAPTEQKVFKTASGEQGWILQLRLIGEITSNDVDAMLTTDNIGHLEFLTVEENGDEKKLFELDGYNKITSSTIRHSEDTNATSVDIQLTKGI